MSGPTYPSRLTVEPVPSDRVLAHTVRVPGSKSISNRAMILAALSSGNGMTELRGMLRSEDTEVMVDCLQRLGFTVETPWPTVRIRRPAGGSIIPARSADLYVANSGTTIRFVSAAVSLGCGTYRLDGVPRMRERPIGDLLDALCGVGAKAVSESDNGMPPVRIESNGWTADRITVRADVSSQFLSGLLLAAPFAGRPVRIVIDGPAVSEPYIDMTIRMLAEWGAVVERVGNEFAVQPFGNGRAGPPCFDVEPDASSASYFFAAPAIVGGSVTVEGRLPPNGCLQGDIEFLEILRRMGCQVERSTERNTVRGPQGTGGVLRGVDVDMNAVSDTVMTLAAVACFAEGPTRIRGVAHIRHKETDRIRAVATELRRLGAGVREFDDGLEIHPAPLHSAVVETYRDHRMAMSLALVGLRTVGVVIDDPGCVAKTYPEFWEDFAAMRGSVKVR